MSAGVSPVPDEAVEPVPVAAVLASARSRYPRFDTAMNPTQRARALAVAERELRAALPSLREGIAAEVLNDAAEDWWARDDVPNRVQTWRWLRERAGNPPTTGSGAEALRAQIAAEVLGPVREYAQAQESRSHFDNRHEERRWLDLLLIVERLSAPVSGAGEGTTQHIRGVQVMPGEVVELGEWLFRLDLQGDGMWVQSSRRGFAENGSLKWFRDAALSAPVQAACGDVHEQQVGGGALIWTCDLPPHAADVDHATSLRVDDKSAMTWPSAPVQAAEPVEVATDGDCPTCGHWVGAHSGGRGCRTLSCLCPNMLSVQAAEEVDGE